MHRQNGNGNGIVSEKNDFISNIRRYGMFKYSYLLIINHLTETTRTTCSLYSPQYQTILRMAATTKKSDAKLLPTATTTSKKTNNFVPPIYVRASHSRKFRTVSIFIVLKPWICDIIRLVYILLKSKLRNRKCFNIKYACCGSCAHTHTRVWWQKMTNAMECI